MVQHIPGFQSLLFRIKIFAGKTILIGQLLLILSYITPRRPEEIENFTQPHYELLNEYKISDDVILNSALFYVNGVGFFNYDGSWADTSYFRLTRQNGFSPTGNPGNALIGAWVDNKQGGWIPRLSWKHTDGEFIAGAEFRIHRSEHWGNIS